MTSNIITWDKYKAIVSGIVANKASFYCRGQSNSKWSLQTSFHRVASKPNINLLQYLDFVIPQLHYYISASQNEIIDIDYQLEFAAFLALVQHHGFPTPLLDWTLSPYIAAYFAFKDVDDATPQSQYVRIFMFDQVRWSQHYSQPLNLRDQQSYVSILRPHAKNNHRIIAQQGVFTVSNVSDMTSHIQGNEKKSSTDYLHVIDIPANEKPEVIRELNLMGINEMSLFPSIDGICRAIKTQFFSADKVGPSIDENLAALAAMFKASAVPTPGKP
jgi:hypothetical protein